MLTVDDLDGCDLVFFAVLLGFPGKDRGKHYLRVCLSEIALDEKGIIDLPQIVSSFLLLHVMTDVQLQYSIVGVPFRQEIPNLL